MAFNRPRERHERERPHPALAWHTVASHRLLRRKFDRKRHGQLDPGKFRYRIDGEQPRKRRPAQAPAHNHRVTGYPVRPVPRANDLHIQDGDRTTNAVIWKQVTGSWRLTSAKA